MLYEIHFEEELPAQRLRQVLRERYGIRPQDVYCGRIEDRSPGEPRPVVMCTPPREGESFGWLLIGDRELFEATGQDEWELATALAPVFGVRALVDDHSSHPDRWILVAADGSSGLVLTDEEGELRIRYALEPISGEPGLTVVPPVQWPGW
ncbi:hypothetical protein [Micromonospora siamensis]|uniref:Uncharacterized protein n=1 Tax=Micromonospora siamensis TaxID=299152 RepID=A0A1C5ING0_9ACTN|nr:hypothetical protein [Micromonospora siamensis]SCG59868.1 hypothetical protein GA0074704_3636 [Micromonospora siamensis]